MCVFSKDNNQQLLRLYTNPRRQPRYCEGVTSLLNTEKMSISRYISSERTILIQQEVVIFPGALISIVLNEKVGGNDILRHPTFVGTDIKIC